MAKYLAYQIILHKLMYSNIIARFPKYKEGIDKVLDDMGWIIDENGNCVGSRLTKRTMKNETRFAN